jgi:hypothetical protein
MMVREEYTRWAVPNFRGRLAAARALSLLRHVQAAHPDVSATADNARRQRPLAIALQLDNALAIALLG